MCKNKWIQILPKEFKLYDIKFITCLYCKKLLNPHFIHKINDNENINADYTCHICGADGDISFFCYKCRHYTYEDFFDSSSIIN